MVSLSARLRAVKMSVKDGIGKVAAGMQGAGTVEIELLS